MTKEKLIEIKKLCKDLMGKGDDPLHGFDHAVRTADNALVIVNLLKIKDMDLNLLQAACYLHDVPINMFKYNLIIKHLLEVHAVQKYLPGVLEELKIEKTERKILFEGIRHHNFTIPYARLNSKGDIYAKILQDADTIDYFCRQRETTFLSTANRFVSYFSMRFLAKNRKKLSKYLNFPELAKHNWYGNN